MLEDEYFRSNYNIRSMLHVLFNADFFKNARFAKVKSPAEAVIGTVRLVGDFTTPKPGLPAIVAEMRYMGQDLANPPTVEGWHTGKEWIDSGTLVERINFTADQMGNTNLPGVRAIVKIHLFPNQIHRMFFIDVHGDAFDRIGQVGILLFVESNNRGNAATTPAAGPDKRTSLRLTGVGNRCTNEPARSTVTISGGEIR